MQPLLVSDSHPICSGLRGQSYFAVTPCEPGYERLAVAGFTPEHIVLPSTICQNKVFDVLLSHHTSFFSPCCVRHTKGKLLKKDFLSLLAKILKIAFLGYWYKDRKTAVHFIEQLVAAS